MLISFTVEGFDIFHLELDSEMEIESVKALIEAESGVPIAQQVLVLNGSLITDPKKSLKQYGIKENDIILIRKASPQRQQQQHIGGIPNFGFDPRLEAVRQEILSNPQLQAQIAENDPELVEAARDTNPQRFYKAFENFERRKREIQLQKMRELQKLEEDPFDMESQKKIEELIRQENINANMDLAMEVAPESFARVFMLYINCEVNGYKAKAFVDSGAQMTIMSSSFAEKCGLARLMDPRWQGIAKGVGSAKIVGRVHMAQLRIENIHLPCSFTILENQPMDILFGLDMLRRHHCVIDLGRNVLKVGEIETNFLGESEIPKGFDDEPPAKAPTPSAPSTSSASSSSSSPSSLPPSNPRPPVTSSPAPSIPNPAHILPNLNFNFPIPPTSRPANPSPAPQRGQPQPQPQPQGQPSFPEEYITTLMEFGVSRQQAIEALKAANGNPDVAASFLFS